MVRTYVIQWLNEKNERQLSIVHADCVQAALIGSGAIPNFNNGGKTKSMIEILYSEEDDDPREILDANDIEVTGIKN